MQEFWSIAARWDHVGQGLFFLIVLAGLFVLFHQCVFYATIWLRGWPSPGTPMKTIRWPWE